MKYIDFYYGNILLLGDILLSMSADETIEYSIGCNRLYMVILHMRNR